MTDAGQPGTAPMTRELMHTRTITMNGYRRSDGLYEIEARLTDTKPVDFTPPAANSTVAADQPIHDITVILAFDGDLVIRETRHSMDAYPYRSCLGGGGTLDALVGLQIKAGWSRDARSRMPSCDTCTHIRELLGPVASAIYQTLTGPRAHLYDQRDAAGNPVKIDTCHAYGATRSLVRNLWPDHYRGGD